MAVGNFHQRPFMNLSDAELDRRLQHQLNALNQTQSQAAASMAAQNNLAARTAGISQTSVNLPLNQWQVTTTPGTPGTAGAVGTLYGVPVINNGPAVTYTPFTTTPNGWSVDIDDSYLTFVPDPPESKEDRKLRKKVDKIFSRLHDQVAHDLQLA
jgi:hypothetical protein